MFVKFTSIASLAVLALAATTAFAVPPHITQDEFRCAMTPTGGSLKISEEDFLVHWYAFANASIDAEFSLQDDYEASTFLGSVAHNTDYLQSMVAQCARGETNTCDDMYKEACRWNCDVEPAAGVSYYPRGSMMLAFACNYHEMKFRYELYEEDRNVFTNPDLLQFPYKGHLSGMFAWTHGENDSCSNATKRDGDFGACLRRLNPWECNTQAGRADQELRIQHIVRVAGCFNYDIDVESLQCECDRTPVEELPKCSASGNNNNNNDDDDDDNSTEDPINNDDDKDEQDTDSSASVSSISIATALSLLVAIFA